jgi:hypothetical protein
MELDLHEIIVAQVGVTSFVSKPCMAQDWPLWIEVSRIAPCAPIVLGHGNTSNRPGV